MQMAHVTRRHFKRGVDGLVDVGEVVAGEAPAAALERLEVDRNGERAHGALAEEVEEAVEVAEAEGEVGIDRLAGAERGEVRFGQRAPQPVFLVEREAVAVVVRGVDVGQARRISELAQRGAGQQHAAEAIGLAVAHDRARRHRAGALVVGELVEELLDVHRRSQAGQDAALFGRPTHARQG